MTTPALRTAFVHCRRVNGSIGSCPAGDGLNRDLQPILDSELESSRSCLSCSPTERGFATFRSH